MQRYIKVKHVVLLLGLLMPAVWCGASILGSLDVHSNINIKEGNVQGTPKGSSIQATIDGHTLTVVFTENLGQVNVEITTASGALVQVMWVSTPDGWQTNLSQTGDYIVTFTLSNGDEYYGEFTVTD